MPYQAPLKSEVNPSSPDKPHKHCPTCGRKFKSNVRLFMRHFPSIFKRLTYYSAVLVAGRDFPQCFAARLILTLLYRRHQIFAPLKLFFLCQKPQFCYPTCWYNLCISLQIVLLTLASVSTFIITFQTKVICLFYTFTRRCNAYLVTNKNDHLFFISFALTKSWGLKTFAWTIAAHYHSPTLLLTVW